MPKYEVDGHAEYLFKLVLVGDSGVGKTSLLLKYVDDVFTDTFISTIGVDFKVKTFDIDGKSLKIQIWDTAGQERFRNIVCTFYRGAHAIFLVYDVTNMTSLQNIPQWRADLERYAGENTQQVLVGNKADLQDKRQVTSEEARAVAERFHMSHVETSAKTAQNLESLFSDVARALKASVDSHRGDIPSPTSTFSIPQGRRISSGGLCNC